MAKEEKPLEYQRRIRDTKGVAQRLDLDYLKRPALLALVRSRLTWIIVGAAALAGVPLVLGVGGSRRVISSGPLSEAHAVFEKRCEVCHTQAIRIPDAACQRCHNDAPHPAKFIDTAKPNTTEPCAECHIEHLGKARLAEVSDGQCTRCHANLASHASGIQLKALNITAFRSGKHPEFSPAALRDTRPLRLNHAIHMPTEPKTIRGMKLPMKCIDCHVTDRNSPTGALLPVTFEQNCKSCHSHELEFDVYQVLGAMSKPSPHTRDAKAIREIVWNTYRDALASKPELLRQPLGNDLSPQPNAAAWLDRSTRDALDFLFQRKCTYCHTMAAYSEVKKVDPIVGRFPDARPWLERGEFSHRAHRAVECESCHTAARASKNTEDVLIPTMKGCLPCHGESRASLDRCSLCHLYHNRTLEKERERRPTGELIGELR